MKAPAVRHATSPAGSESDDISNSVDENIVSVGGIKVTVTGARTAASINGERANA
jgi:hypothetical protein